MKKYGKLLAGCLTTGALCMMLSFAAFADETDEVQTGWVETDDGWMYLEEEERRPLVLPGGRWLYCI